MQESLGITFQKSSIQMAHLKKSWGGAKCTDWLEIPGPVYSSQGIDSRAVDAVTEFLLTRKIRSRDVYAVARQEDVLYKMVTLPKTALENIGQVLGYEFENYFPFPMEEGLFDFKVLDEPRSSGESVRILVAAIRRERFEAYRSYVQSLGLNLAGLEPPLTARSSFFHYMQAADLAPCPLIVLDSRELAIEAELYLSDFWEWKSMLTGPTLYEKVKEFLFQCEAKVMEREKNEKGVTVLPLLALNREYLSKTFREEIEEYFPASDLSAKFAELGIDGAGAGVLYAFGTALQSIERRKTFNYVPPAERKKQPRGAMYLCAVLAAAVIISGAFMLATPYVRARSEYGQIQNEIADISKQVKVVEQKRARIGQLKKRLEPLTREKKQNLLALMKEMTQLIPEDSWLTQLDVDEDNVRIRGQSENANALIVLLEKSPLFKEVAFSSPVVKRRGKDIFYIEMKIEE
jgi:Tfp pilus assembly protein PilN